MLVRISTAVIGGACLTLPALVMSAAAQSQVFTLPQIDVTASPPVEGYDVRQSGGLQGGATRTDTPLLNVPQSVVVIPRQVIDEEGLQDRADALRKEADLVEDHAEAQVRAIRDQAKADKSRIQAQ